MSSLSDIEEDFGKAVDLEVLGDYQSACDIYRRCIDVLLLESENQEMPLDDTTVDRSQQSGSGHISKEDAAAKDQVEQMKVTGIRTRLEDVVGHEDVKKVFRDTFLNSRHYPKLIPKSKVATLGVLLYGPPGTGKSFLVEALAGELSATVFNLKLDCLLSKWRGTSEKVLKQLFEAAKECAPAIIFVDEVEVLVGTRSSSEGLLPLKNLLLTLCSGITKYEDVVLIGATNSPNSLDNAFSSRFHYKLYVPLPAPEERRILLSKLLEDYQLEPKLEKYLNKLVLKTQRFSGRDIMSLNEFIRFQPFQLYQQWCAAPKLSKQVPLEFKQLLSTDGDVEFKLRLLNEKIKKPFLTKDMVKSALLTIKPTATDLMIMELEEFARGERQ